CPIVGQIWEAAARTPSPNENVEPSGCRPSSSATSGMPSSPEVFYGAAALVVRYVFDRMPPGLHGVPPSWRCEQEAVHAAGVRGQGVGVRAATIQAVFPSKGCGQNSMLTSVSERRLKSSVSLW
ncbi:hypothetical protein EJB05_56727, partial [Eragrostis curvula]